MAKWVVAMVVEFDAPESQEDAEAFVDEICNSSSTDFVWLDTITNEADKLMMPKLGVQ